MESSPGSMYMPNGSVCVSSAHSGRLHPSGHKAYGVSRSQLKKKTVAKCSKIRLKEGSRATASECSKSRWERSKVRRDLPVTGTLKSTQKGKINTRRAPGELREYNSNCFEAFHVMDYFYDSKGSPGEAELKDKCA
ncbi:Aprataxin And Pnk-Like Factor [Manis pentadactyla]|nr:Aprataxin And Pnk-Like Factor [Manis pentadactyla]